MQKKLNKIVNRINSYLYRYLFKQKKTELIKPMLYGLLPGWKKLRSKILFDIGSIFKVDKKTEMRIVRKVHDELKEAEAFKVVYSVNREK